MRITQRMITRTYLTNINSNLSNMSASNERLTSGRKFTRISDNLSDGTRALRIRRQLSDAYEQKATIRDTQGLIDTAWSTLNSVNSAITTAYERAIKAADDTHEDQREVYGTEIASLKQEILQLMNSKYADKNLFGGSNNNAEPFTVDEVTGNLLYNGVDISNIKKVDGEYKDASGNAVEIPFDEDLFVDLGNGLSLVDGKVDSRTGFKISFNGLDIMGFGTETFTAEDGTTHELSNNIFNILSDMEKMLKNPDQYDSARFQASIEKLEKNRQSFMLNVTDIDGRASYLDTMSDRVEEDIESLTTIRSNLEGVNDTDEILKYKMYEYTWLATLKMGANLLPQSLMDYIS